jgi:CMP-N-acetylneuraminic acid synthetase
VRYPTTRHFVAIEVTGAIELLENWPDKRDDDLHTVDPFDGDGWARLLVDNRPIKRRPVRRQDLPKTWVFNGAIYLFKAALLWAEEPSLYGDRVAAYPMALPDGHNIDDDADWAEAERILSNLA